MSQQGAINSGAINVLSFPGAESGLSLVQMVGAVSVTCRIIGTYRRVNANATTTSAASSSGDATLRRGVEALASGTASTLAAAIAKSRSGASTQGAAPGIALVSRRLSMSALTSGAAAAAAAAAQSRISFAATAVPAAVASVASRKKVYVVGSATARAVNAVAALRKLQFGAQTIGRASSTSSIRRRQRIGATAISSAAAALANTALRLPTSATTVATIAHSVTPYRGLLQRALGVAVASGGDAGTGAQVPRGAGTAASVQSAVNAFLVIQRFVAGSTPAVAIGSVQTTGRIATGAYTVASFESYIVATDLNITQPAPTDRQMVVPLEERRMEVGES